jgi:glutamate synthase domain-containing protein 1
MKYIVNILSGNIYMAHSCIYTVVYLLCHFYTIYAMSLSAIIEIFKHSFFSRTVKDWNTLTESAVSSKTVEGVKAAISRLTRT